MRSSSADPKLPLALVGFGRMGREIEQIALARGHRVVARIHPRAELESARTVSREALGGADVALEFTHPKAALANVRALAEAGCRHIVVGTTGWKQQLGEVETLVRERRLALVHADNFSVGMAYFSRVLRLAAELYVARGGYDPHLVEWHHRAKRDAPSGTARGLSGILEEAMPGLKRHYGSVADGLPEGTFQVAAVRTGVVPGTHLVGFESEADSVELKHTARGRSGFARGAVLAAEWVFGREGLFTFDDVLGKEEE